MGRRLTSRRKTMRGGAWFKYSVVKDEDFQTDACNKETKKGKMLMKDIVIAKKILKFSKDDIEENTAEYNRLRTKPSKEVQEETNTTLEIKDGEVSEIRGMYIPLSADTYDVYKGRNIFHKYYGYGRIVEYKEYSPRKGGGYGYYCKFDNEALQDYTYTFATTSRLIQKLSNTILIETFPFEMIVQVYCDYITKIYGESKTKQEDLYNMLMNSTAGFSKYMKKIEKSVKLPQDNEKYKDILSAAFGFFDMKAPSRDLTDTVKLMQDLEELKIKIKSNPDANDREDYIHKWGKVFLGLPDALFSGGDHVNSEELKAHFEGLTPSFTPTESEANTRLKRIKIDSEIDGKLQKLLKMVWSMYKPNTPSSRAIVPYNKGGFRGGDAVFAIFKLIFLPVVIVFIVTLICLVVALGLIVAGIIIVSIPVWAPITLLMGIYMWLAWDPSHGGGGGGPRRRISMARRDKTKRGRRSGSRKKTKAKRPRRISLN